MKRWALFSLIMHVVTISYLLVPRVISPNKASYSSNKALIVRKLTKTEERRIIKITNDDNNVKSNSKIKSFDSDKNRFADKNQTSKNKSQDNTVGTFGGTPAQKSITTKGAYKPEVGKGKGISSSDDIIDDAVVGPLTLLNTQEYKYYNYYERIRERVAIYWRPLIRKAIEKERNILKNQKKDLPVKLLTTKIEVILDDSGNIVNMVVKEPSGFESFDKAGQIAFNNGAPYPEPPKELVKNHRFTIRWDFSVNIQPAGPVELHLDSP